MIFIQQIKFMFSIFPKRIPVIIIMIIISSFLEIVGIGAIVPILEFFLKGKEHASQNIISETFYHVLSTANVTISLTSLFGLVILLFLLKTLFSIAQNALIYDLNRHFTTTKFNSIYKDFLNLRWAAFQSKKTGFFINTLTTEFQQFLSSIQVIIRLISESILFLFYIILSLIISFKLTLAMATLFFFSYITFSYFNSKIKKKASELVDANNIFLSLLTENFFMFKWIKASGFKHTFYQLQCNTIQKKADYQYKISLLNGIVNPLLILFSVCALATIAFLALKVFNLTFSYFLLITLIFQRLLPRFQTIQKSLININSLTPSIKAIFQIQNFCISNIEPPGHIQFNSIHDHIIFKNVKFKYDEKPNSFELNIKNLTIKKHDFIALIGSSGCGKTTFIDCLTSLHAPQSGSISIDGINLQDYDLTTYRQKIGIVSQDIYLFHGTIRANLTVGLNNISEDKLHSICKDTYCLEFIQSLPDQFDTVIGEKGMKLSGGQRQRIALARALIHNPEILILDEATSALDAESESYVQQTIDTLKGKTTIILISHRLASIRSADHILVLDKGQIIEQGSWKELSQDDGKFKLFKDLQFLE